MESKFYSDTKLVKLKVHPRSFSQEDLIVNLEAFSKDKFQLFETIIVEIFAPEDAHENQRKHLLLEVKALPLDIQAKGSPLSISSEVAHAFKLNGLKNVSIRRVDKKEVGLDMVEVRFKDQTMTRSDMWRFTQSLIGKGMYHARKLEFIHMRAQVTKLWAQGRTVRSGVVVDSTRLVFRSMSAQLFLGIQISSEMWDFDPQGDIYFDKAVDGFLKTLFKEWKAHQCNHKVTLFLFARQYYKLTGRPMDLTRPSILRDKRGRYYEDFYDVIIDEEARDDWQSITMEVKKSFLQFQKLLGPDVPDSKNGWHISSSVDGNILESINMAVNVFEHHYIDSSFTTTGQQVVIVSPGVGVFEVEYELNRLTKERIIDFGVGVDLVCLNEQPLHAVPLFRYQQQHVQQDDQYYIPHWINYSFFNPLQRWMRYQFHPTIKMSDALINKHLKDEDPILKTPLKTMWSRSVDLPDPLARVEYDEYDDSIFSSHSTVGHSSALQSTSGINFTCDQSSRSSLFGVGTPRYPDKSKTFDLTDQLTHSLIQPKPRHHSDNYDQRSIMDSSHPTTLSSSITETQPTTGLMRVGSAEDTRFKNGQAGNGGPRKKKSFINPFDPSKVHMEDSSHQHRWMHAFPRDSHGQAFQTHHVSKQQLEVVDENSCLSFSSSSSLSSGSSSSMNGLSPSPMNQRRQPSSESTPTNESLQQRRRKKSSLKGPASRKTSVVGSFSTVRRNGIDLPSLLEPASLPLTTDYFPEDNILNNNYVQYPGTVTVNNYGSETALDNKPGVALMRSERQNITPVEAFKEMISQRLSQGFQLVFTSGSIYSLHHELDELTDAVSSKSRKRKRVITVQFSLSRVFQVIRLNYPDILTYMYRAKKPLGIRPFHYHYRLKCYSEGDSDLVSCTSCWFSPVMMENYNWNYLDQHICGYEDFEEFQESNKYWRCRLLLLPFSLPSASAGQEANTRWVEDIVCGFVRFVEFLNHIKRGSQGAIKRQSSMEDSVGSVQRFGRASLPVSPSPRAYSPLSSPSPSPVFGRSRLSDTLQAPATPNRSSSEPSGRAITIQGKKVARPSLPNMRASQTSHRSATQRQPRTNRQVSLTQSATSRSRQDIVDSLRQLTISPSSQRAPSPNIRGRRQRTIETDSVMEEDENEDSLPTGFNIVPPSPLRLHSDHFDDDPSSPEGESEELTLLSSPARILQELLDPDDGVDLLSHHSGLRSNCFVAMEAVRWLMERLSDAITRAEAVKILQKLVTESLIVHASGNKAIPFIDGFFLYCLCADQRGTKPEIDWETYRKSWFEVKIHPSSLSGGEGERNTDTAPSSLQSGGSPYYMDYKDEERQELERSFYLVELNPDTQAISDRPEWCCVRYSSMFQHMTGFEVEFQWIATTASLLKKMIQGWNYKAALCQFNLVPVPSMAMLKGDDDGRLHPFREPIFIPMRLPGPTAPDQCARIFEAILNRFGFLVDPASLPSEAEMSYLPKQLDATSLVYVHHSGCALVQPVTDDDSDSDITPRCSLSDSPTTLVGPSQPVSLGLNWFKNNLYLRQKSTSASMLTKHDSLFNDVKRFCNENTEDLAKLCPDIFP